MLRKEILNIISMGLGIKPSDIKTTMTIEQLEKIGSKDLMPKIFTEIESNCSCELPYDLNPRTTIQELIDCCQEFIDRELED
jgi:hypothetical protein